MELIEKDLIVQLKELSKLFPKDNILKKKIEYIESGKYSKHLIQINKHYDVYIRLINEYLIELKRAFQKSYENSIDKITLITSEIEEIDLFLKEGKQVDITIFDWSNLFDLDPKTAKSIYRKLIKGLELKILFYEKVPEYKYFEGFTKVRALLFYQEELKKIINGLTTINESLPENDNANDLKLTMKQIALIYVYEGGSITKENSNEIAKRFKHNSGHKLYQYFNEYYSKANRKAKTHPYTKKKMSNKIELFESIVKHLHEPNKQRALDEIKMLKTLYKNDLSQN